MSVTGPLTRSSRSRRIGKGVDGDGLDRQHGLSPWLDGGMAGDLKAN